MKVKSESEVAQSCLTLCDTMDHSPPGSCIHGIFQARVLEWGAIAFSDPYMTTGKTIALTLWTFVGKVMSLLFNMLSAAAAAKSLQSCPTLQPHRRQPPRLPHPWDSPSKNTGVGCHCLLQCMKVNSESEVSQLCPTLSDPIDCSLPGSCIHGIFQARVLEWGAIAFSECLAGMTI